MAQLAVTADGATERQALLPPGQPADLTIHLGIWLATIAGEPIKLVRGDWLPPTTLALLNQRLALDGRGLAGEHPVAAKPANQRSERRQPYLAFLHYLAMAAGLAAVERAAGSRWLEVTPLGWQWLAADHNQRSHQLWQAWVGAAEELAQPYAFDWEPLSPAARSYLSDALRTLPVARWLPLSELLQRWRLQDLYGLLPAARPTSWLDDAPLLDPVRALCSGAWHWLGLVELSVERGLPSAAVEEQIDTTLPALETVYLRLSGRGAWLLDVPGISAPVLANPAACTVRKQTPDRIEVPAYGQPLHLARLARYCRWLPSMPGNGGQTLELEAARVAQAAAAGVDPEAVIQVLQAALGRPPSRRTVQRLRRWAQQGQQVRLRPLLVLETATPSLLAQLRRHKLVRKRLGEGIAPTRVVVNPLDVTALLQTLRTLDLYVEPPAAWQERGELTADGAGDQLTPSWQWLLVCIVQQLAQFGELPLALPWAVRQRLLSHLSPAQQAAAEELAHQVIEQIEQALAGYLRLSAWAMPAPSIDPIPILTAAMTSGDDIEIRYWGAGRGHVSQRRVTPLRFEERDGSSYLHAWCHLRNAERVFRLDRIEAVTHLGEDRPLNRQEDRGLDS